MKRINRKFAALLLIGTMALGIPLYVVASEEEAKDIALRIAYALAREAGLTVRDNYNYGFLYRGQSYFLTTTLYRSNTYYLVAGGCSMAHDVDIMVYDENYNLIARDADSDKVAVAEVDPRWNGTFHIKVHMYNCSNEGAHWVLLYAYK